MPPSSEGASAVGAFGGGRLVGIGVVLPHVRPRVAQLVALYVSNTERGRGVGSRLCDELERVAREADGRRDGRLRDSVREHGALLPQRRGFAPMAEPLPELLELEPEDIHMRKSL